MPESNEWQTYNFSANGTSSRQRGLEVGSLARAGDTLRGARHKSLVGTQAMVVGKDARARISLLETRKGTIC
jgi:hypothetical protein